MSLAYQALRKRFGAEPGRRVYDDFRDFDDPEAPTTTPSASRSATAGGPSAKSLAMIDPGSIQGVDPVVSGEAPEASALRRAAVPAAARGVERAAGRPAATKSGAPIAVMGPQVGYYSPQILMEMEIHGPDGHHARGATFPGISLYVLLGRGQDFAWSATTATTDVVDEFVEKLCEPDGSKPTLDSEHYMYKGKCVPIGLQRHSNLEGVTDLIPPPDLRRRRTFTCGSSAPFTARPGARHGEGPAGGDRRGALHLLPRARLFARLQAPLLQRGARRAQLPARHAPHELRVQLVLRGRPRHRLTSSRAGIRSARRGTHPDLPAWGTGQWDWQGFDPSNYSSSGCRSRAADGLNPSRGLSRQLEQQAGARLAGGRRLLELRLDAAHDATGGPRPSAASAAAASSTWRG